MGVVSCSRQMKEIGEGVLETMAPYWSESFEDGYVNRR